jgi:Cu2+-containing amine oxidase
MVTHPFQNLDVEETRIARDVVLSLHPDVVVDFREIYLQEPEKEIMKKYLDSEHAASPGRSSDAKLPPRLAKCQYDVIGTDRIPEYHESVIDIEVQKRVRHQIVGKEKHASLTLWEFEHLVNACKKSKEFQDAIAEFKLPDALVSAHAQPFSSIVFQPNSLVGHMADPNLEPRTEDISKDYVSLKISITRMRTRTSTLTRCRSFQLWTRTRGRSSVSTDWRRAAKVIA